MHQALSENLYRSGWVPDTFEARAGMVTAHSAVMFVRLADIGLSQSAQLADELNNCILDGFDAAYRELGVGDATIARKVRTLAELHAGAGKAIARALGSDSDAREAVEIVLQRNGYVASEGARPVAVRLENSLVRFREQEDAAILKGNFGSLID